MTPTPLNQGTSGLELVRERTRYSRLPKEILATVPATANTVRGGRQIAAERTPESRWPSAKLAATTRTTRLSTCISCRAVRHLVQYFFRQRLGIALEFDDPLRDDESFDPGRIEQWSLKNELARATLNRDAEIDARLVASGMLGHGFGASSQIEQARQAQGDLLAQLQHYADNASEAMHDRALSMLDEHWLRGTVERVLSGSA